MREDKNPFAPPSTPPAPAHGDQKHGRVKYSCATLSLTGFTTWVTLGGASLVYLVLFDDPAQLEDLDIRDYLEIMLAGAIWVLLILATILFVRRDQKRDD